jgi:phenylalanyl-tRNA synthetase beta chain
LAAGQVAQGVIDIYPQQLSTQPITVRLDKVNGLLGTKLAQADIKDVFQRLTFTVVEQDAATLLVQVPSFRVDIEREVDLIEEVARLIGYENIQTTLPKAVMGGEQVPRQQLFERALRNFMVAQGFNEVINFSFHHPASPQKLLITADDRRSQGIKVLNPLVEEQSVMRTTLIPSLLETTAGNLNHRQLNQRIFELRRLYLPLPDAELPHESLWLGAVLTGLRENESWCQDQNLVDFYDVKGLVEELCAAFGIQGVRYATDSLEPYYHPGKGCTVVAGSVRLGSFGELHPDVQTSFGLTQPVFTLELSFEALFQAAVGRRVIVPPSRFPDISRDVALLLADAVSSAEVIAMVQSVGLRDLAEVGIFDVYHGEHVPEGHKSVAIRIRYHSHERTLTDEEVGKMHQKVVNTLIEKLGATIR